MLSDLYRGTIDTRRIIKCSSQREKILNKHHPHLTFQSTLRLFYLFFNHQSSRGERLTVIQRSTIVAFHNLNLFVDLIVHLTHCDRAHYSALDLFITINIILLKDDPQQWSPECHIRRH